MSWFSVPFSLSLLGASLSLGAALPAVAGFAPVSETLPSTIGLPGAIEPRVSQASIGATICRRGYSASGRPPVSYTESLIRTFTDDGRTIEFRQVKYLPAF